MTWEVWGPPIVVLLLALVVAMAALLWFQARGLERKAAVTVDDRARELEARKAILLDELRELEADRHKLDATELAAQREALIQSAADVLREADAPAASHEAAPVAARARAPIGWLVGAVAFFALLGLGLSKFSTPRKDDMARPPPMADAAPSAEVLAAQKALEKDPNDLKALNALTHEALRKRDVQAAMGLLDRARAIDEDDVEVQTHLAVLQIAVGMFDRADAALDSALATHPRFGEAWIWKGVVALNRGDVAAAKVALDKAIALDDTPSDLKGMASAVLAQMESGAMPPQAPDGERPASASQTAPKVSQGAPRVSGTVSMAAGSAPQGTLFVIARRTKEAVGPPVAVQRMPGASVPTPFSLDESNLMLGGEWPPEVFLEARIDRDGNVMSKEDIVARSEIVGPVGDGTSDAALLLAAP
jgi:cytochrome c-type biogenesis protein CcmH/NrfG